MVNRLYYDFLNVFLLSTYTKNVSRCKSIFLGKEEHPNHLVIRETYDIFFISITGMKKKEMSSNIMNGIVELDYYLRVCAILYTIIFPQDNLGNMIFFDNQVLLFMHIIRLLKLQNKRDEWVTQTQSNRIEGYKKDQFGFCFFCYIL